MPNPERDIYKRPNPEALLALAGREGRGKLKVFLGAAPGVGKTFAMLSGARRLQAEGLDVVIGLAETHGRSETAALIEGLEVLPLRSLSYKDKTLYEFDIDAALLRKPQLLIVDELAHTNAPDSRHPKRYQDIDELLSAGINVWTALNIQHLESLADVVAQITSVSVRETIPDTILKKADEVVLVDITPAELIDRLKEGKIYLPDNALRAADGFFKPGNLTALRELALRRTADRVDDQMVDYLRQNAIEGPWPTSERLMVCVGGDLLSETVIRTAARLASGMNASWVVISVERPGQEDLDAEHVRRIDEYLRLSERLGATIKRLTGIDFARLILREAHEENITQIVIGRSHANGWRRLRGRSLPDELVRLSTDISVHVVTNSKPDKTVYARKWHLPKLNAVIESVMIAVLAVSVAVGIGHILRHFLVLPNLSMVFLTAVLFCAFTSGLLASVLAAFLSFFAYNFFFIEPVYTFTIAEPHELFALLIFLVVAILTGTLVGRLKDQANLVKKRAITNQALYELARKLSGTADLDNVLWTAASHINAALSANVVFALPNHAKLELRAAWPPVDELSAGEESAALWTFEKQESAGWQTSTLPMTRFQFRPLLTTHGVACVCGIEPRDKDQPFSVDEERVLTATLDQTAVAIDRAQLTVETLAARARSENEKLRATLLSSLSHDLRTPLASIMGAATTLRDMGEKMPVESRIDLSTAIVEETDRLTRFVLNMLDMSRIETGELSVKKDLLDIADVIQKSVERGRKIFPDRQIEMSVAKGLPHVCGDAILLGQVLFNLLDNANKYGGIDVPTSIHARQEGNEVLISVTDEGIGIKQADMEKVFEKFYRGGGTDGRSAGTGLGLSICRGLVEAMGGSIVAQSPAVKRRGTRMILKFPAVIDKTAKVQS